MSERTFKCKYCNFRGTRERLVHHTEKVHQDLIPEGYTAARLVFNNINNKDHGTCVVCKRETPWNEKTWKYDRLCGRPECAAALRKQYEDNMLKTYGTTNILDDPEQQERMLANRKISGTYKFSDGGSKTYTGSYEKKTLEFFDKVLECHSSEIITPGPVLEYEYNGEKHKWITDILYIPYNLIIEVKDGGSNPNNRQMDSYREKQDAKELMITNLGTYNYLRLTNNNFQQLLLIMAELKMQMIDDSEDNAKAIIRINENTPIGGMNAIPASTPFKKDKAYVIPMGFNNVFSGNMETVGFMRNLEDKRILTVNEKGDIEISDVSILDNRPYSIYEYSKSDIDTKFNNMILSIHEGNTTKRNKGYFYEVFSDKEMLTDDQIMYDNSFKRIKSYNPYEEISTSIESTLYDKFNDNISFDLISLKSIEEANKIIGNRDSVSIKEDVNGYFVINIDNGYRSRSVKDITNISEEVLDMVNEGGLLNW